MFLAQEEEKAIARSKENWEWTRFEAAFTLPKDFVLLELELCYRNGCLTLFRTPSSPLASLEFGAMVHYKLVRGCHCNVAHNPMTLAIFTLWRFTQYQSSWLASAALSDFKLHDLVVSDSQFPVLLQKRNVAVECPEPPSKASGSVAVKDATGQWSSSPSTGLVHELPGVCLENAQSRM